MISLYKSSMSFRIDLVQALFDCGSNRMKNILFQYSRIVSIVLIKPRMNCN